jgi:signal transduction histidine kinase/DNA-binding response OmpR family regulator
MDSRRSTFFDYAVRHTGSFFMIVSVLFFESCTSTVDEKIYRIGFSQCVSDDLWRQTMHQEMRREVMFYQGAMELEIKDAQGDNQKQILQIEEFLDEGIDLLLVSPNESVPITPVVEKAFNIGIPVIILDRKTTSSLYTAYVGADSYEIGRIAGRYIDNLVQPGDKIVEIWGLKGSSPAIGRNSGFVSELTTEEIEVVNIYADWTKEESKRLILQQLDFIKDAKVIFAHNDQMALGAYEVFREAGIKSNCLFTGVDALPGPGGGIRMVTEGILDATFLYQTGGEEAIRTAYNILHGLPYEKENTLQTTLVDASNVRIMKLQTDEILSQQNEIEKQQSRMAEQLKLYKNQQLALYLLLGFLTLSIILGAYALYSLREKRLANKALRDKNQMISEQKEEIQKMAEKAEEATNAKFKFFTNISHEFRTPLTLILGPLDGLMKEQKLSSSKEVVHELSLIRKNANRLLRLVNQLMAFRKIEHNKLKINVSEQDIVGFIKDIHNGFENLALKNNIDFQLSGNRPSILVWFDRNWLDKVIFNLLSNAFKFTPGSGFIHIRIREQREDRQVIIEVEDNGRGMSQEHVEHAFDRFHSGAEYSDTGTGLGLSLSRELIHLHKGSIDLVSQKNVGTTFSIKLRLGNEHFDESEMAVRQMAGESLSFVPDMEEDLLIVDENEDHSADESLSSILIVEDNRELSDFLKGRLKKSFKVLSAFDGVEGLEMAVNHVPDIIICDVMIPGKDGLIVTKSLKSDSRTSHIPVILLTAKSEEEQKISGIKAGADVYVTKPFNFEFLYQNITNLLRSRAMLKAHYLSTAYADDDIPEISVAARDPDKEFVRKFKELVNENLHHTDFGVKEICHEMGFSRVQLYRKVKALLDSSVNDYVNTMRLRKALKLLKTTGLSISDIAYECGFSSPTYFSTAFKTFYQVTPSDVRRS